jgi:hypothetical protein
VDAAARKEADMRVHALVGVDQRLHVRGPAEADGIDHPLHAGGAGTHDFELYTTDVSAIRARHGRQKWIHSAHVFLP